MTFARRAMIFGPILLVLMVLPWLVSSFMVTMMIRFIYFGLLTISLTFMISQLGLVSLGQASFFGIASYTVAIMQIRYGVFFPFEAIAAVALVLIVATLFALMAVRTRGIYFLMLTLVLGQIVYSVANQWSDFTRGDTGMVGVQPPAIAGVPLTTTIEVFFVVSLLVFLITLFALVRLKNSPFGLMMRGVKNAESRMKMLGYPVQMIIFGVFLGMSVISALGGLINVYFMRLVNPTSVGLTLNVDTLVSGILGGVDSLSGAVLGTAILRTLSITLSGITARYRLVTGLLFLGVVLFAPAGIVGLLSRFRRKTTPAALGAFERSSDDEHN